MGVLYFLKRHGGYFRPGAHGYTQDILEAGIFSREEANRYRCVDSPIVEIIAIEDLRQIAVEMLNKARADVARSKQLIGTMDSGEMPSVLRENAS